MIPRGFSVSWDVLENSHGGARKIECPPAGRISAGFLKSRFFGYSSSYCTEKIVTRVRFRCSCFFLDDVTRFSSESMSFTLAVPDLLLFAGRQFVQNLQAFATFRSVVVPVEVGRLPSLMPYRCSDLRGAVASSWRSLPSLYLKHIWQQCQGALHALIGAPDAAIVSVEVHETSSSSGVTADPYGGPRP